MMLTPQRRKSRAMQEIDASMSLVAPIRGWNARDPEANMAPGYALYLDNWFPQNTTVETRKGAADHVTGFGASVPVAHLHTWNARSGSPSRRLFGFTNSGIYDVTSPGAVGAAVLALSSGKCSTVNFGTTGGSFILGVNGADSLFTYDGASWTQTATLPVSTAPSPLATNTLNFVHVFKRRAFFLSGQTMEFYTLPIDSITGTLSRFPLGALFTKGGFLKSMGTWTIDGGSGIDDFAVFVTSEGQMAIYKGTDPTDATAWFLVGVYNLTPPLSNKCFQKYGGDLLYISRDGVFPLSRALIAGGTPTGLAVTDIISTAFSAYANTSAAANSWGWGAVFSGGDNLLLFNVPTTEFSSSVQLVMNTKTKAWARFTGWDSFCWEIMDGQLYMGMNGKVAKAMTGLQDFGGSITCYGKGAFDYLGSRARLKKIKLLRPIIKTSGLVSVSVGIDVDFNQGVDYGPSVFSGPGTALWDVAQWDVASWSDVVATRLDWITVAVKDATAAAIRLRCIANSATVDWSATDLVFETGNIRG